MQKIKKILRIFKHNPKIIFNFLYSIFINLKAAGTRFFRFPIVADFPSTLKRSLGSKLIIDKRLYIGGKYIAEISGGRAYVKLAKGASMHIQGRAKLGPGVRVITDPGASVVIGDNTYLTASSLIYCSDYVRIGSNCAIAWGTTILDTDFHEIQYSNQTTNVKSAPIHIGDKVWIGCNCTILKGVTIGNNCVIAANTLVNKNIPPNCLAGGNPVRIIKENITWKP